MKKRLLERDTDSDENKTQDDDENKTTVKRLKRTEIKHEIETKNKGKPQIKLNSPWIVLPSSTLENVCQYRANCQQHVKFANVCRSFRLAASKPSSWNPYLSIYMEYRAPNEEDERGFEEPDWLDEKNQDELKKRIENKNNRIQVFKLYQDTDHDMLINEKNLRMLEAAIGKVQAKELTCETSSDFAKKRPNYFDFLFDNSKFKKLIGLRLTMPVSLRRLRDEIQNQTADHFKRLLIEFNKMKLTNQDCIATVLLLSPTLTELDLTLGKYEKNTFEMASNLQALFSGLQKTRNYQFPKLSKLKNLIVKNYGFHQNYSTLARFKIAGFSWFDLSDCKQLEKAQFIDCSFKTQLDSDSITTTGTLASTGALTSTGINTSAIAIQLENERKKQYIPIKNFTLFNTLPKLKNLMFIYTNEQCQIDSIDNGEIFKTLPNSLVTLKISFAHYEYVISSEIINVIGKNKTITDLNLSDFKMPAIFSFDLENMDNLSKLDLAGFVLPDETSAIKLPIKSLQTLEWSPLFSGPSYDDTPLIRSLVNLTSLKLFNVRLQSDCFPPLTRLKKLMLFSTKPTHLNAMLNYKFSKTLEIVELLDTDALDIVKAVISCQCPVKELSVQAVSQYERDSTNEILAAITGVKSDDDEKKETIGNVIGQGLTNTLNKLILTWFAKPIIPVAIQVIKSVSRLSLLEHVAICYTSDVVLDICILLQHLPSSVKYLELYDATDYMSLSRHDLTTYTADYNHTIGRYLMLHSKQLVNLERLTFIVLQVNPMNVLQINQSLYLDTYLFTSSFTEGQLTGHTMDPEIASERGILQAFPKLKELKLIAQ